MPDLILRKPVLEDGEQVCVLVKEMTEIDAENCGGFPLKYTAMENFDDWMNAIEECRRRTFDDHQKFEIFFSFRGEELVGFIIIFTEPRKICPFFDFGVVNYYIRPKFRRKGLGAEQLKLALRIMPDLGFSDFLIMTKEDNCASRSLLENCGGKFKNKTVKDLVLYKFSV
ncbi:MAG: GNAT family N-acetyltransferase [bacterium]|nr:GNAT family N-acetyltransferase [bacterium]